jgi:RNA polymerase sigma-70 factor (ECF subfamily)
MYKKFSDKQLLKAVAQADHAAFAELVQRHTQNYFALAYRSLGQTADAEDIVQMAFIKLWQNPSSWDASKSAFTTWFYRVVINACHDFRGKNKFVVEFDPARHAAALGEVESAQGLVEQEQDQALRKQCLEMAISQLNTAQRDALNLVVYCGLPQQQAAEILGVSVKALESMLVRAKRSVKKFVAESYMEKHMPQQGQGERVRGGLR